VTKEHIQIVIISGEFVAKSMSSAYNAKAKFTATNLKTTRSGNNVARWLIKGARTGNDRKQESLSHNIINVSVVAGDYVEM
jgi:hypothetical protein